jgi:hypothetical protein
MSMKRTKQRSFGKDRDSDEASPFFKAAEPEKTYEQLMEGKTDDMFAPYDMAQRYEKGALLSHTKFGKGIVIGIEGMRIEVLFAQGPRKLGHGTQPPPMRPKEEVDAERAEAAAAAAAAALSPAEPPPETPPVETPPPEPVGSGEARASASASE